jgi:GT2 family glycosyltransferase/tetratricopeptide (TPR) repeat protein/2-polyprenyl-3-methyl-5-hydroxy-6-metoxy-1,4-benzoquinol methylase
MRVRSIAVCFDNLPRPETTGGYCLAALRDLASVRHVRPAELDQAGIESADLYLRIDDGLDYTLPSNCKPSAWWAIDTHLDFERCLAQARTCDLTFAAQRDGAGALRRAGIGDARWLPLACDPAVHRPHALPKQYDISFVGNVFPGPRSDLLELIRRKYRKTIVGNRYFEEMARTYSASRTVFNRSVRNDVNMRVFEALACGSLLLTNDLSENGQTELFGDGVHLATYRDAEELLDKLAYYLAHDAAREKVETAGRQEAVAKHTYRHRMERILEAAERVAVTVAASPSRPIPPAYDPGYFEFARPELIELVPADARDILDVGCGAGRLGAALKARQPCRITGLELDAVAAAAARTRLDEVHIGDVEGKLLPVLPESFDAVICGDVLEHLREPLDFLRRLRSCLRPGGVLIASVPNVRHHSVVRSLLEGNWTYEPAGLLDRTHLRFFTRREIEKLFLRAGFEVESLSTVPGTGYSEWDAKGRPGEVKVGRLHIGGLTTDEAQEFYAYQYLVVARPANRPDHGLTSIIILTHNQLPYTRQCIDSIRLLTDEPYELIFVDNGSTDGTERYLRSLQASDPTVKVIANAENRGFPAGANQGIAAASGRQVLLLNNDTLVTTGWLARMLRALYTAPDVGLVGPCSDNVSGEQQVPTNFDGLEGLDGFAWDWAKAHDRMVEETDRLVGFCLLVRRELIERIGVLDERFGLGCFEDDDYCRRALRAGFKAVIARDVFIHHVGGATFQGSGIHFAALMQENGNRFHEKWTEPDKAERTPEQEYVLRPGPDGGLLLCTAVPRQGPNAVAKPRRGNDSPSSGAAPALSLCMIVKDNARTIEAALKSIRPWVDEMVVVDTGSSDETPAICTRLGSKVFHFPWCDDFSAARNESLRHATGRWLFWMDSDDTIDEANGHRLRQLVLGPHDPKVLGYIVQVHCPGGSGWPEDITAVDHVKLIRNRPDLRFEGRIHEQILMPIRRAGGEVAWTDLFVLHSGYDRSPEGQRRKLERDLRLLNLELAERPDHPFTLFNLGMTYGDIGEHQQTIEWMRRCIAKSEPGQTHLRKAYSWLVSALTSLGNYGEALRECEMGLASFPLDTELRFRRGGILHLLGRLPEAAAAFEDLLANEGERCISSVTRGLRGFLARQALAQVREEMGDLAGAEPHWRAAVEETPKYRPAWHGLWSNILRSGKVGEAEMIAARLQADEELAVEGAILAAQIALKAGNLAEVRRVMERALAQFPNDSELLREWSRLLVEQIDAVEAEPFLQRLVELEPDDAAAWHNLGTVRAWRGRHAEAVEAFQRSLACRPDAPVTRACLERALDACKNMTVPGQPAQQPCHLVPEPARARKTKKRRVRG